MTRIHSPSILKISSLFACFFLVHAAPNGSGGQSLLNVNPRDSEGPKSGLNINTHPRNSGAFATGTDISLNCQQRFHGHIWWSKDDKNLTDQSYEGFGKDCKIKNARIEDTGNYTCVAMKEDKSLIQETIEIKIEDPVILASQEEVRARSGASITLSCPMSGNKLTNYKWNKIGYPEIRERLENKATVSKFNESHSRLNLNFKKVTHENNGTYECSFTKDNETVTSQRFLIVTDVPDVKINIARAVGLGQVYLNWTVNAHNEPVNNYFIEYQNLNDSTTWQFYLEKIDVENSSLLLKNLEKETMYRFRITAANSVGNSTLTYYSEHIMTSGKDPYFVPKISVDDTTDVSIKIALESPPPELKEFAYYYEVNVTEGEEGNLTFTDLNIEYFTVPNLKPGTNYKIKVAACNYYTKECGGWSDEQEVQTLDESGKSSSAGLHPAGINIAAAMIVSLYSLIKYVST